MQEEIKKRITDHLTDCGGNALIIFDEMQKFANGSFDKLQSGFQNGGSLSIKYAAGATVRYRSISTENAMFLFVSDTGADKFQDLLVAYGDRNKMPQSVIRRAAHSALVKYTGNIDIAKLIEGEVIPHMPMEETQIKDLFKLMIRKLQYDRCGRLGG